MRVLLKKQKRRQNPNSYLVAASVACLVLLSLNQRPSATITSISSAVYFYPYGTSNDTTTDYSSVSSLMLSPHESHHHQRQQHPQPRIMFTNFGFYGPNATTALQHHRCMRIYELYKTLRQHPWYYNHASTTMDWNDYSSVENETQQEQLWFAPPSNEANRQHPPAINSYRNSSSSTAALVPIRHYVFVDVDTCMETNWPVYGHGTQANSDYLIHPNRTIRKGGTAVGIARECPLFQRVLQSPLFRHPDTETRLVLFNCQGDGPSGCLALQSSSRSNPDDYNKQEANRFDPDKSIGHHHQVSHIPISIHESQLRPGLDMGMMPPSARKNLTIPIEERNERMHHNCSIDSPIPVSRRDKWLTFVGNFRDKTRRDLLPIHNPTEPRGSIHVMKKLPPPTDLEKSRMEQGHLHYDQWMLSSRFAAVPRGDNLFSYRFTEVIQAGAIPIVYADGWALPFGTSIVDWEGTRDESSSPLLLRIPEQEVNQTIAYLENITLEQECRMRQGLWKVFEKYMATPQAEVQAYIDSLEQTWGQPPTKRTMPR